ncbi:uncharacterized protein [Anoplolepis gracilipes]|uniref:uncharacterized protein n=1 Tax=Anoplolepis gracilipes TaxID=354296 RepID=UPI003B9F08DF
MSSPLSPIIADIVLQDLESKTLNTLQFIPPFYFRFVDDIIIAVPSDTIDETLNTFNSQHDRLQFTIEVEKDHKIDFLDIIFMTENNILTFDWYHKLTFSGRYLNYFSHHPKRGTIIGLVDKVIFFSNPRYHRKNLDKIIRILLDNNYPLKLIFDVIGLRLKTIINKKILTSDIPSEAKPVYFTLPYIKGLSEKFNCLTKNSSLKLAQFSLNKMNKLIRAHKDIIPTDLKTNVIYKINCSHCDASYVGQTSRKLKTRINEHKRHIHLNTNTNSIITNHRRDFEHNFDWENVRVLDEASFYTKRLISEMLFIKRQRNGLNLQTDTENLPSVCQDIVNTLPKI